MQNKCGSRVGLVDIRGNPGLQSRYEGNLGDQRVSIVLGATEGQYRLIDRIVDQIKIKDDNGDGDQCGACT